MRIVMLSQFYPPMIGGEERHVQDLSVELVRRGHEVAVVTLWYEGLDDFEMDRGVRIYRLRHTLQRAGWLYSEPGRRHAPPFPDPEALIGLRRVLLQEKPDIVHAHNWLLHAFLPLKRWSGAGLVVSLHDYSLLCAKKRRVYRGTPCDGPGLTKCIGCSVEHYGAAKGIATLGANYAMSMLERRLVDMFLPVSYAAAAGNGLVGSGIPYTIIPNFVPDDIGAPSDQLDPCVQNLPEGGYLLFVGDLSRDKGVHILLQAYAQLKDAVPLVLIGRHCADIPNTFPPNVLAMGGWPHSAVMEAWRRCLIGLVPSTWHEPFGIVAIEAMAAARPVIASRVGGLPDILIDGETGYLVPSSDPAALSRAIEQLLADPALRERMGQAAQCRVNEFRMSRVIPRIERIYTTIIEHKCGNSPVPQQHDEEEGYFGV